MKELEKKMTMEDLFKLIADELNLEVDLLTFWVISLKKTVLL